MKIRCEQCGQVTDIINAAAIIFFVQNNEFICPKCKKVIKIRKEENENGKKNI